MSVVIRREWQLENYHWALWQISISDTKYDRKYDKKYNNKYNNEYDIYYTETETKKKRLEKADLQCAVISLVIIGMCMQDNNIRSLRVQSSDS